MADSSSDEWVAKGFKWRPCFGSKSTFSVGFILRKVPQLVAEQSVYSSHDIALVTGWCPLALSSTPYLFPRVDIVVTGRLSFRGSMIEPSLSHSSTYRIPRANSFSGGLDRGSSFDGYPWFGSGGDTGVGHPGEERDCYRPADVLCIRYNLMVSKLGFLFIQNPLPFEHATICRISFSSVTPRERFVAMQ